jgi:ABC-2 type transport system ATP-binding protein
MLKLIDTKKSYHSQLILHVPFLCLENGIYWVKGANGSGKTTLLKMVAALIPFDGDIVANGISLKSNSLIYRQNVSWAEAEPLYPPFMSGMDLISLYRDIRKASSHEADELIQLFNMQEYIKNSVGSYSTGMTKKLSLVLAFIGNAPLIVLDEPLITLDPEAFSNTCKLILSKHINNGTGFLMSSHQELDSQLLVSGQELIVSNQTIL